MRFGLVISLLAVACYFMLSEVTQVETRKSVEVKNSQQPIFQTTSSQSISLKKVKDPVDFKKKLVEEGRKVGAIDSHPKETRRRLMKWAKGLTKIQKNYLSQQAINEKVEADLRFLSVYLLHENGSSDKYLIDIADHPIEVDSTQIRLFEQEIILRTMALEGVIRSNGRDEAERKIKRFISRQDNTMLIHQAYRLLETLNQY